MQKNTDDNESFGLATAVSFRITAIYSLVLGLSFASLSTDFTEARRVTNAYAANAAQVYSLLERMTDTETLAAREQVLASLNEHIATHGAYGAGERPADLRVDEVVTLTQVLVGLNAGSSSDEVFKERAIEETWNLGDLRIEYLIHEAGNSNRGFWAIFLVGFAFVTLTLAVSRNVPGRGLFLSLWFGFIALVAFLTHEVSQPFSGMIKVSTSPLDLVASEMSSRVEESRERSTTRP
jgi:hypothetical protein